MPEEPFRSTPPPSFPSEGPAVGAPPPTPPPSYLPGTDSSLTSTGLTPNIAAGLACLFTFLSGIVFLVLEKRSSYVRFWAMQATIFGGAWFLAAIVLKVVAIVFGLIPVLGWIVGFLIALLYIVMMIAGLIVWIIMLVKAFSGQEWEIPVLGPIARQQLARMGA